MKHLFHLGLVLLAFSCLITSCKDENEDDSSVTQEITEIQLSGETRAIVETGNRFAFDLFKAHSKLEADNIHISPISVYLTLAMNANYMTGSERDVILSLLNLNQDGNTSLADVNEYCREMLTQLPEADRRTTCRFANSLWTTDFGWFSTDLLNLLQKYFFAQIINDDPSGIDGMEKINTWVKKNTDGYYTDFLKEPIKGSYAFVNVAYFYGKWTVPFEKEATKNAMFYNLDNTSQTVPMMNKEANCIYYEDNDLQLVAEPYGNRNFQMVIILPKNRNNFETVVENLNNDSFNDLLASVSSTIVNLYLPKFINSYDKDLIPTFEAMIPDFKSSKKMKEFRHGVKIGVDESETKVAAASLTFGDIAPGFADMKCNHPFIYIIRETTTGAVLYMGKVVKF